MGPKIPAYETCAPGPTPQEWRHHQRRSRLISGREIIVQCSIHGAAGIVKEASCTSSTVCSSRLDRRLARCATPGSRAFAPDSHATYNA